MANYDKNDRNKSGYYDQYVNFNQFLMQHNINNWSPLRGAQSGFGMMAPNQFENQSFSYNASNAQNAEASSTYTSDFIRNSNLTATASEFVPQQPTASSSSLYPTANEFVPRKQQSLEKTDKVVSTSSNANDSNRRSKTEENVSNTDSVTEAINNAHISEDKRSETKLNSNGGAIKKVRSQDYRQDSRDRHSNGDLNRENFYSGKRQTERYDDYRRRKNDNMRQNNVRANKYDSNRNYRGKNDNYDDGSPISYRNKQPPRFNKANSNNQNTNGDDDSPKNRRNDSQWSKKKERNERDDKKYDGKRKPKSNGVKIDTANCSQREKLIREIDTGRLECLVCYDMIKPHISVWSCPNCYHIMHLNCIMKWAESSKSEEGWRCCACQNITKVLPREYFCFCGKQKNPQYNRNDMAHTCGDVCGRVDGCLHPCTQLCHPGPCPPCQVMVTRECCCGKTSKMYQCNQKVEFKCEQECEKDLNCKVHKCEKSCHSGNCEDCPEEIDQSCFCKREKRTVACTKENHDSLEYSCEHVCDKQLKCGKHKCKELCHIGDCATCELLPDVVKTCPCGKMQLDKGQRSSCEDIIPLCTSACKKRLTCGQPSNPHGCVSKCHYGPCPPCNKQTAVKCRCGNMDQNIKCSQLSTRADDARCKKKCTRKRNCGKHKCNQECCIDIDHECPMKCTYTLSCGKHKCESTCHKGRCLPCYRSSFDELYCECGANVIYPPVPCGTKRPVCERPCSRQHPCDHEVTHNCHSAQSCPPCMAFTKKYCHGRHEQRNIIPCSQKDFSCGLPCNKPLKCGRHKCIKTCHAGPCENETDVCKQNCTKQRIMCPHACNAPCHLDSTCPETICRESIEVLCQCGLRKQLRTCHDISSDFRKVATAQLASSMDQMQNGGIVELSDVLGPIKMTNNKTLECNEECRVAERNRRLAIGLQIRNPDLPSKLQPKYSEFIRGWAKKDPKLIAMIHTKLTELVKLAKESKQKSRSYSFPTMNREKRQLVHEMCAMFGVESQAYDAEPNRNVVASATRVTSWLPSISIMEIMERESGQRRVIVPNLNAWGIKR